MPKLYDTGLACHLLGLEKSSQLETHYLKGALLENTVILEVLKHRLNRGLPPNLYFWRDHTGHEVDLIAEWGGELKAIEIKASATFQKEFTKSLHYFSGISDTKTISYVVYTGDESHSYKETALIPVAELANIWGAQA